MPYQVQEKKISLFFGWEGWHMVSPLLIKATLVKYGHWWAYVWDRGWIMIPFNRAVLTYEAK